MNRSQDSPSTYPSSVAMILYASLIMGLPYRAPAQQQDNDPVVRQWLDRLEQRGEDLHTLECTLDYNLEQTLMGDETQRTGKLFYKRDGEKMRFKLEFTKLTEDNITQKSKQDYIFDGHWLSHLNHDEKIIHRWEVVPPDQEALDPLRIGNGPFPLPVGQKTEEVLAHFTVVALSLAEDQQEGDGHLMLTPIQQDGSANDLRWIEMWIDAGTHLPYRVRTEDESGNLTTVKFDEIRSNKKIKDSTFDVKYSHRWELIEEAWQQ